MSSSPFAQHWTLDPDIHYLNHGSFGATPRSVLAKQTEWRARMEAEPVRFFMHEREPALANARSALGRVLGAYADDLAFLPNATTGVNTALRALAPTLRAGDEVCTTTHEYNACRNALEALARDTGANVVIARMPFPCRGPDEVVEHVLRAISTRTRILLLDHVTSPTALVWPLASILRALARLDVNVVVDGAHAPGMLPLDLHALGVAFYAGNCHKWLCAPKGAGFLYVRSDLRPRVHPLVISHGANAPCGEQERFRAEFDWTGTTDPTAYLCVPDAIAFLESCCPGGLTEVMARNRALCLEARALVCDALGVEPPAPDEMLGSMATLPLPDDPAARAPTPLRVGPLQSALYQRHQLEGPIVTWPAPPKRWVRLSAQLYNHRAQYEHLARALVAETALGAL